VSADPPPRKPGRPPLDPNDPSVRVCFRLPGRQYDDLYHRAQRERTDVGTIIRRRLRDDDSDTDE
jgi:hypothetical protein